MNYTNEIKIILVDDHELLREGLKNIIEKKSNMVVIGEASNGREAVKICSKLLPDIVLIDIAMPDLNGVEATSQILKAHPKTKVIGLSMHSGKQFIQGMFNAGAFGYLLKDGDAKELIIGIKTVMENRRYLSKNINQEYLKLLKNGNELENNKLSSREKEVLQLIAEGKSSKEIGEILFLSPKTIDVHRINLMKKINVHSLPELTKYAIKKGFTTL